MKQVTGEVVKKQRPVNLKLTSIGFPITAISSVLHRASGVLLFLFIPAVLWTLWYSLASVSTFTALQHFMQYFWFRFALWLFLSGLIYHMIAGGRHLLMDMHFGDSLQGGRFGAIAVLFLSIAIIALFGVYILISFNHVVW